MAPTDVRAPAVGGYHWAPLLGGGLLTVAGLRSEASIGVPLAIAGAALLYSGLQGGIRTARAAHPRAPGLDVSTAITVRRSAGELYAGWRDFSRLPAFMRHLHAVEPLGSDRYRFEAQAPFLGSPIRWEAEVVEDRPNERIRWCTPADSAFMHAGTVSFRTAPGGRGTEVNLNIAYRPRGTVAGAISRLLGTVDAQVIKEELRRFKRLAETGEIPTNEGQPSG